MEKILKIPRKYIDSFTKLLEDLSEASKRIISLKLAKIDYKNDTDLQDKLLETLEPLLEASTDQAAAYAAIFYDILRMESTGEPLNAVTYSGRNPETTERALQDYLDQTGWEYSDALLNLILGQIDYEIKKAASEAVLHNANIDPLEPRFARVPAGADTCPFCIMLASRGFVYHSRQSAGELNHFHANCRCRVIPGFPGMEVEGYDPSALYEQYLSDLKSGRLKISKVKKFTKGNRSKRATNPESTRFKTAGDFTKYIRAAESIDDLQMRCAVVESEFPDSGLSGRTYDDIRLAVADMKEKLIRSVA